MNFTEARHIPVQAIAEHLGGKKSHHKTGEIWYYSPFRPDEKTASFKVNEKINTWYDFAEGKGGSGVDLWLDYHQQDRKDGKALKSALDSLKNLSATPPTKKQNRPAGAQPDKKERVSGKGYELPRFKLLKEPSKIFLDSLKEEVGRRGFSLPEVAPYLKQANFTDTKTGKKYSGLSFPNDKDGLEISVPNPSKGESFKTNIGIKTITSITTGTNRKAAIFEGMWDFLTWLRMNQGTGDFEAYILNSVSFVGELARQLIEQKDRIHSVFLFLDNDTAGEKATHEMAFLLEPDGFLIGSMNHIYEGYKDLNDYWMKDPIARQAKPEQNKIFYERTFRKEPVKPGNDRPK